MKTSFASVLTIYVRLTLCSFLFCIEAEQCGVMVTVSSQDDYLASLANMVAVFKSKCRKKTMVSTSSITTPSVMTETSTTSQKGETSTNTTTSSVTNQLTSSATPSPGWPRGMYGLPTPVTGCPADGESFTWETGTRLHDTDNDGPRNGWPFGLHLQGPYGVNDMVQSFCMKTQNTGTDKWPVGRYCVFKYANCQENMLSGSITWDDEDNNNMNKVHGIVPSGVYNQDTLIEYCCMTDGDASQPISLPTQSPFYLFPYNSEQCQAVQGMATVGEYFVWDQESWSGIDSYGSHPYKSIESGVLKISYCYYTAA